MLWLIKVMLRLPIEGLWLRIVLLIQLAVITTFALSVKCPCLMMYSNALIPLIAEPIHIGRNDRECNWGHFCYAKAGVSRRKSVMPTPAVDESYCLIGIYGQKYDLANLSIRICRESIYDKIKDSVGKIR